MADGTHKRVGRSTSSQAARVMFASAVAAAVLLLAAVFGLNSAWLVAAAILMCLASSFSAFHILREQQVDTDGHESDVSSDRFRVLATSSHEIRTPLNGVIGMINLLLETRLSAEQENYARTANNSARTLLSIVDETLDTAKSQATRDHESESTHIRPLVEHVTELLAARAHAKGIELSAYVASNVSESVKVRDLQLRQILFNLVGNAIKFTETGGVSVDILAEDNTLLIKISDTGIGMTAEEKSRVFTDYAQANSETTRRYGGTGLGLGITKRLVGSMNGRISLESTQNQGTAFTIHLPDVVAVEATAKPKPLAGRHIWLASSSGISGEHAARMIVDLGGTITRLKTADELKAILKRPAQHHESLVVDTSFASILKDWAAQAHRKPANIQPQIWVMLKPEDRRHLRNLLSRPFAGYLLKPLRLSTLLQRLSAKDARSLKKTANRMRAAAAPIQKRHILVADDNAINVMLVSTMLKKAGYAVTHVNSGAAVMDILAAGRTFDALLLDIEMPGLNGYETAELIRKQESHGKKKPALPILALTAHRRTAELQKCLAAGMNSYVTKPFDQQDLIEALGELLHQKAA